MCTLFKRTLIVAFDIAIAAYLILAVTAFNRPADRATVCSEVKIDIDDTQTPGFLDSDEIKRILQAGKQYPLAKPIAAIDPRAIEETLRCNPFVEQAECYIAQSGHVCILLRQRTPILHVMSATGENYYLDTQGTILPESPHPADVLIATGSIPPRSTSRSVRDYSITALTTIAHAISSDPFWRSQVEQINILPDGSAELVPRVGSHIIYLGPPVNIAKKLSRLLKFYKYGLNVAGWNKYTYISVEFDNQIICKKK